MRRTMLLWKTRSGGSLLAVWWVGVGMEAAASAAVEGGGTIATGWCTAGAEIAL